jgi:hypothetical protein
MRSPGAIRGKGGGAFASMVAPWRNPERARLGAEVKQLQNMVDTLNVEDWYGSEALESACGHLRSAYEACKVRDVDSGWAHAFRAREQLVRCFPDERLLALARTLRGEVREKGRMAPWRQQTIERLLKDVCNSRSPLDHGLREQYYEALRLRDQGLSNQYVRLRIVRHHQLLLGTLGAPALVAAIILLSVSAKNLTDRDWKSGASPCILAVLLGILGATVSAAQRSTTAPPHLIAEQFASNIASLSRLPIGAVGGLTAWLFTLGSVNDPANYNVANMLLAAFGAGFAERLIVQGSTSSILGGRDHGATYPDGSTDDAGEDRKKGRS